MIFVHFRMWMYLQQLVHSDSFLHMRVDVEKTAEQRLATFQKSYAKSSFIHSNLRFSAPGWTSSLPNRWRLRTSKIARLQKLKLSLYDRFSIFFPWKPKNFETADASCMQSLQSDEICGKRLVQMIAVLQSLEGLHATFVHSCVHTIDLHSAFM